MVAKKFKNIISESAIPKILKYWVSAQQLKGILRSEFELKELYGFF